MTKIAAALSYCLLGVHWSVACPPDKTSLTQPIRLLAQATLAGKIRNLGHQQGWTGASPRS
jgi:hypothetical protein